MKCPQCGNQDPSQFYKNAVQWNWCRVCVQHKRCPTHMFVDTQNSTYEFDLAGKRFRRTSTKEALPGTEHRAEWKRYVEAIIEKGRSMVVEYANGKCLVSTQVLDVRFPE